MESFGIWNLLKTMLDAGIQPPENNPSQPTDLTKTSAPSPTAEPSACAEKEEPSVGKNACEDYFLRHERLKGNRRK